MYTVNIKKLQRRHRREMEAEAEEAAERERQKLKRASPIKENLKGVFAAALAMAYAAFGGPSRR